MIGRAVELLAIIASVLVGVFGGVGLERYRNSRKDHEHRQANYHELFGAADDFRNAHEEPAAPDAIATASVRFARFRQGIEVFGARDVMRACQDFERAVNEHRWDDASAARESMIEAARRDVGPRGLPFGWRR